MAWGAMIFPAYFVIAFAFCYISAFHAPTPHEVDVAIVGPPAVTTPLQQQLQRAVGDQFNISTVPNVDEAVKQVRDRTLNGAFVPRSPAGSTVIVAGAAGASLASAIEGLFRPVAAAERRHLEVRDVRPLPPGDESGTAAFYLLVICTIGGYLTVTVLGQVAPGLRPRKRYPIIAAAALATPIIVYLIGGLLFDAYDSSFGTTLAMIGIGALYALIIGLLARGLQVAVGTWAIFAMMAVFVFLNFPSSGGAVPADMLPPFWRFLHGFWIGAPAVEAMRSTLYFDGQDVANDILKLFIWLIVLGLLLMLPISRKRERERQQTDVGAAERSAAPVPG